MNLVTLDGVSKQYSERLLLDGVSLLINEGDRIGLIGVNGSGKTTLLRLIAGLESPDAGSMTVWGGVRIQYLPQEPRLDPEQTVLDCLFESSVPQIQLLRRYERASRQLQARPDDADLQAQLTKLSDEMTRTGGWAAEANAKSILTRLGMTAFDAQVGSLSGGQQKRVALAHALIDPADLLILDEPTNHIDADTIAWLESYLLTVPGALLMVTHDRYFLDRVANQIVELDRRQLVSYAGSYTHYLATRSTRHERLAAAEAKQQKLLQRELAWLHRSPTARGTKQKARAQRVAALQEIAVDRGDQRVMMALASRRLGKKVLEVQGVRKAYGDRELFADVSLSLVPGDRIGLIGPNGIGKSTLLDILTGHVAPDAGSVTWGDTVHVGYYDQHSRELRDEMTVLEYIVDRAPLIQTPDGDRVDAGQMLEWFLFSRPQQRTQIGSLSGGERRRLYLLGVLVTQPNVLLLDEPTNDLDIQTLTVLEAFLDQFQGCVIAVSHDRYFLDRTVDYLAAFENGRFSARYPTPYSSYQALKAAQETADAAPARPPAGDRPADERPRRLNWQEKRELAGLNGRVETLEADKAALQAQINAAGGDYVRLQALASQLSMVEAELDGLLERWVELSEIADAA